MPSDRLREKAVLTAVEAIQKSDDYFQRAKHIKDKFDADENGSWFCFIKHADDKANTSASYYNQNYIRFRVGCCYLEVLQQSN